MSQLSYTTLMVVGVNGQVADNTVKTVLSPLSAIEQIPIGCATAKVVGADYEVRLPMNNLATLVFSADLVASNVINGSVGGSSISPVTYATSHLNTMGLIATAIEAIDGVESATVGGDNNRTITIVMDNEVAAAVTGWAITAGASQATITATNTTSDSIFGVALFDESQMNGWSPTGSTGPLPYQVGQSVSNMSQGHVFVTPEVAVTSDDPVYVRFINNGTGKTRGQFRNDSDSGKAFLVPSSVCAWLKSGNTTTPAVLSIFNVQ